MLCEIAAEKSAARENGAATGQAPGVRMWAQASTTQQGIYGQSNQI